jgi:hypothetical protein
MNRISLAAFILLPWTASSGRCGEAPVDGRVLLAQAGMDDAMKELEMEEAPEKKPAKKEEPKPPAAAPAEKAQGAWAKGETAASAPASPRLAVPEFLDEPVSLSGKEAAPAGLKTSLSAVRLGQAQYAGSVTMAKESIRLLSGETTPQRAAVYEARWAPIYDNPSPELTVYLNRLNPLLLRYATLQNAMGRAALEHDQALAAAKEAARGRDEAAATTALATVHERQVLMASILREMEAVAKGMQAQGKPPDPRKSKARARQRHEAALARLQPPPEAGELDGYWESEREWTYEATVGMGTPQAAMEKRTFVPKMFIKKVKALEEGLDAYFVEDYYRHPWEGPKQRRGLWLLERQAGGAYAKYFDFDYPNGCQTFLASGGYLRYSAEWYRDQFVSQKGQTAVIPNVRFTDGATWLPSRMPPEVEKLSKMTPEQLLALIKEKYPKLSFPEIVADHRRGKSLFEEAGSKPQGPMQVQAASKPAASEQPEFQPPQKSVSEARKKALEAEKKAREELRGKIQERESLIAYFQSDIARLRDQLRTNPQKDGDIRWLIMNRESDIILERDRIRELQTGEFVRSRTPFDDHCLAQIVVGAQKEVSRMAQANRDYKAAVKLIGKLPYSEQQQAWKTLDATVRKGGSTDPAVIGKLKGALRNKIQGSLELESAKADEKMADADDLVARAEKVKGVADSMVNTLSLVTPGGQTIANVYGSITGSIDALTDPDATKAGALAQAGANILEVWTGDILEKTRFKKWKDGLSGAVSGLNAAQKEYREARKEGKDHPVIEGITRGTFAGVWSYVANTSGDRIRESKALSVDGCIQAVNAAPGFLNAFISKESEEDGIPTLDKLLADGTISDVEYGLRQIDDAMSPPAPPPLDAAASPGIAPLLDNLKKAPLSSKQIEGVILPELEKRKLKEARAEEKDALGREMDHWKKVGFILQQAAGGKTDPVRADRTMQYQTGGRSLGQVVQEVERIAAGLQPAK